MNLDDLPHVAAARLVWLDQITALPRAIKYAVRRLFRREPREYLLIDGKVIARFVSRTDARDFMMWVADTHERTFDFGFQTGKEHKVAVFLAAERADAGDAGPS